jgi:hypothetical protein
MSPLVLNMYFYIELCKKCSFIFVDMLYEYVVIERRNFKIAIPHFLKLPKEGSRLPLF